MSKITELQNQWQTSYPGPQWLDSLAEAVAEKLGTKVPKPDGLSLTERVAAWRYSKEKGRDQSRSADNRPDYQISAESLWRRPEHNRVGEDNVIRPVQPVEEWADNFEWNQARLRMAGHFQRTRLRAIYHENNETLDKVNPGPNVPVDEHPGRISW